MGDDAIEQMLEIPSDQNELRTEARALPNLVYLWDRRYAEARSDEAEAAGAREMAEAKARTRIWASEKTAETILDAAVSQAPDVMAARLNHEQTERRLARVAAIVDGLRAKREVMVALLAPPAIVPLVGLP